MEPVSRELLRRAVRRTVHQHCLLRLEGDFAATHTNLTSEIDSVRAAHPRAALPDAELESWIAEDETEFDRAMLISDLVARRVQRTAAPVVERAAAPVVVALPREPVERRPARTAPSISTLLDDMFAQERTAVAAH